MFPKIHQHVDFPTWGNNTLDFVYTPQRGAYKALPLPHLGTSDHIIVMLIPAYRPIVKVTKPVHKQIQVWPEGSSEALQDCFNTTDWNMFKQAATYNNTTDLQEYSETVTANITKCIDDVTVTKTITVRANQKPWLTGEVYRLLKARNAAFRAGDEVGLRTARANLSRGIREAKRQCSRRIAHHFSDSRDTLTLWQGIQTITDYKPPPQTCDSTIPLLNELNAAFARFEAQNSTTAQKTPPPPGNMNYGATVESVSSTKFLGVHITEDLSWTYNTAALAKKAQQCLYFLRKLRRARAPASIMCTFRGTIERILTSCITVWYGACNASCRKSLQRIVRAAEKIVGVSLPSRLLQFDCVSLFLSVVLLCGL